MVFAAMSIMSRNAAKHYIRDLFINGENVCKNEKFNICLEGIYT